MASCLSCLGLLAPRSRPRVTELETTTSTCTTEAVRRIHVFEIQGYKSLLGRTGAGESVQSAAFEAGGYDWAVRYYPHGCQHASPGYASVFVELLTPGATARASCEVTLLPVSSRAPPPPPVYRKGPRLFCRNNDAGGSSKPYWEGWCSFVKRRRVEERTFLGDDTIRIQCAVTVLKEPTKSAARPVTPVAAPAARVKVPPSNLASDLAKLLDPKENVRAPAADVTVFVGEEAFAAHSYVLWARCRTLYDRMTLTGWASLKISECEVRPAVFKALLHYIYTDSLPAMDDLGAAGKTDMIQQLLVAADLYGVERLKLMCERTLCTSLQAGTVVATLALADQLHSTVLRRACIQFIISSTNTVPDGRSIC